MVPMVKVGRAMGGGVILDYRHRRLSWYPDSLSDPERIYRRGRRLREQQRQPPIVAKVVIMWSRRREYVVASLLVVGWVVGGGDIEWD